jgi:hypothetical protein
MESSSVPSGRYSPEALSIVSRPIHPSVEQKTGNGQHCRRRKGLMRHTAMSCFPSNEYIGINSGARRASCGGLKFWHCTSQPRAIFKFGIRTFCVRRCSNGLRDITPFKFAMRDRRDIRDICPACPGSERDGQDKGYVIALSCPARRSLFSTRDRRRTAAEPGSYCQVAEHGSV